MNIGSQFIFERDISTIRTRLDAFALKVPTGVYVTDHNTVLVCMNGETREISYPTKPFKVLKAYTGLGEGGAEVDVHTESVLEIGTRNPITIQRREYEALPMKESKAGKVMMPSFDYVESLIHEYPDIIPSLVWEDLSFPYYQTMDIETWGKTGNAFNPKVAELVSIQVSFPDTPIYVLSRMDFPDERDMIVAYIEMCKSSPTGKAADIIVGYNHTRFDIPFMYERIKILGIHDKWEELARTRSTLGTTLWYGGVFYPHSMRPETERSANQLAPGIALYDLYHHVRKDMAKDVKNLPSKKLEKVAEVYGMENVFDLEVSEKRNMMGLLQENPERFCRYASSDIEKAEHLFLDIYGPRTAAMANLLSAPFAMTACMSSGEIATIPAYRACRKNGYFATTPNWERHKEIVNAGKYQGAIVDCFKTGYFDDIIYLDASAMYPTIMEDFLVSYDTHRMVRYVTFDEAPGVYPGITDFHTAQSWGPRNARTVLIPDENLGLVFEYEINLETPGFLVQLIREYKAIRKAYKKKAQDAKKRYAQSRNEADYGEYLQYDAIQQAAKVINNTFYGLQGDKNKVIADYPAGIFITGIGRWQMQQMIDLAKDSLLESDSVTGETPLFIRHRTEGWIDIVPISFLHPDVKEKRTPYSGEFQILSRNGWADILYTKAHATSKRILRTKCSDSVVSTTCDHSLFTLDQQEISPDDLKVNDQIEHKDISLLDFTPIYDIPLDADLAWLYGLFLAEGSVSHQVKERKWKNGNYHYMSACSMSISMQNIDALVRAKTICNEKLGSVCGKKPGVLGKVEVYDTTKSSATHRLTGFYNRRGYDFFKNNFYVHGTDHKKVPRSILNCSDHTILSAFIEGYGLGDGCTRPNLYKGTYRHREEYTSVDSCLIAGVRFILNRLGKMTCVHVRDDKEHVTVVKVRHSYNTGTYRDIDRTKVLSVRQICKEKKDVTVYDVATSDGTFVSALGGIVLHNTDGIIIERKKFPYTIEEVNHIIKERMANLFGLEYDKILFELEFEGGGSLYLYKMKTYIYLEKGAEFPIIKGSAFQGYHKASVIKEAVSMMASVIMTGKYDGEPMTYNQAVQRARDIRTRPLEDFVFTFSAKRELAEYKGFADIGIFSSATETGLSPKKRFAETKKRAREWLDKNLASDYEKKRMREIIADSETEDELSFAIDTIRGLIGKNQSSSNQSLNLLMQKHAGGHEVSAGDEIPYVYTLTEDGVTLLDNLDNIMLIDHNRYLDDINRILKRFEKADPRRETASLF